MSQANTPGNSNGIQQVAKQLDKLVKLGFPLQEGTNLGEVAQKVDEVIDKKMAIYDRTKPHLGIGDISKIDSIAIKYNPNFIPEKLKQIYREKFGVPQCIDAVVSKSETNLSEEQIRNILLFFQGGFSDAIMFHPEMKSYLIEEDGLLRGYFSHMAERLDQMDVLLEKKLLERGLSYDEIVSFLISKSGRLLIDGIDFETHEDGAGNAYYIPEHSMKVFRESIDANLDEILGNF